MFEENHFIYASFCRIVPKWDRLSIDVERPFDFVFYHEKKHLVKVNKNNIRLTTPRLFTSGALSGLKTFPVSRLRGGLPHLSCSSVQLSSFSVRSHHGFIRKSPGLRKLQDLESSWFSNQAKPEGSVWVSLPPLRSMDRIDCLWY